MVPVVPLEVLRRCGMADAVVLSYRNARGYAAAFLSVRHAVRVHGARSVLPQKKVHRFILRRKLIKPGGKLYNSGGS